MPDVPPPRAAQLFMWTDGLRPHTRHPFAQGELCAKLTDRLLYYDNQGERDRRGPLLFSPRMRAACMGGGALEGSQSTRALRFRVVRPSVIACV